MKSPSLDLFADPNFIEENKVFYDRYIKLRVHGYPAKQSFLKVFGLEYWGGDQDSEQHGQQRVEAMECTPYYLEQFDAVLKAIPPTELWNAQRSIHERLTLIRNPYIKASTQLSAQRDLDVLLGIVVIDENGKTKAGRSLDDFYASLPTSTPSDTKAG